MNSKGGTCILMCLAAAAAGISAILFFALTYFIAVALNWL